MLPSFLSFFFEFIFLSLKLPGANSFPRQLTAEEERGFIEASAKGDKAARDKLVEHNLRLVAHIIKKYYSATNDQDDLISIGTIGLIKAIKSFNAEKCTRLSTYASKCIENEIFMYFRQLRRQSGEVSLYDTIDTDNEGNSLGLIDLLFSSEDLFENLEKKEKTALLRSCVLTALDDREREIVVLRYGLSGKAPLTQREVAELLGISRSYISRIEKAALEKLRGELGDG